LKTILLTEPYRMSLQELPEPQLNAEYNVLVKVHATGICGSDIYAYRGEHRKRKPPVVLGHEIAGEVVAVASGVSEIKVGDRVAIEPQLVCGTCDECKTRHYNLCLNKKLLGAPDWTGGFGEYVAVPEKICFKLAANLAMDHAALAEPLAVGVHAVRSLGAITPDMKILIVGGGPIGLLTALAAHASGIENIAVADIKTFNIEAALGLGLSFGVQVTDSPLPQTLTATTGWKNVDAVFVAAGGKAGIGGALACAKARGKVVILAHYEGLVPVDLMDTQARELDIFGSKMYTSSDFQQAVDMLNNARIPCDDLITHRVGMVELPDKMQWLNGNPEGVIKAVLQL
jgi:L-iditol 2-dehydrogenase